MGFGLRARVGIRVRARGQVLPLCRTALDGRAARGLGRRHLLLLLLLLDLRLVSVGVRVRVRVRVRVGVKVRVGVRASVRGVGFGLRG